jgi:hypothetical protein
MKKSLVITALLAAAAAHAESLRVNVPFTFSAAGTIMPAGEYAIRPVAGSAGVLLLDGVKKQAFVFGRIATDRTTGKSKVVFKGDVLVGVTAAGRAFELSSMAKPLSE